MEKEYSELEVLFHQIMSNMKVKHLVVILHTVVCYLVSVMLNKSDIKLSYTSGVLAPQFNNFTIMLL